MAEPDNPVPPGLSRERARAIKANALGIGLATGAYAISFGAISVASGLSPWQTQALSALMFTGASQFALVGILGSGGGVLAAVLTAWLLGARNGLYGLSMAPLLNLRPWQRPAAAHLTIDESTAMGLSNQDDRQASRLAFWWTGLSIYLLWNLGTLLGALGASSLADPGRFGLDAAIPAGFMALLWPRLRDRPAWIVATGAAVLALLLTPITAAGVPVLASGLVAVAAGLVLARRDKAQSAKDLHR